MIKSYSGWALPKGTRTSYQLDYRCPVCKSEDVSIDPQSPKVEFCDGGPSTRDSASIWICASCHHKDEGTKFVMECIDLEDDECQSIE